MKLFCEEGWLRIAMAFSLVSLGQGSGAATFFVGDPVDSTNVTSLRGALIEANRVGGRNTILLTGTNYQLTLQGTGETNAATGDLDVTRGYVSIVGMGSQAVLSGEGLLDRVFHVWSGSTLSLQKILIRGGSTRDGQSGGAILNEGTLWVSACTFEGNRSGRTDGESAPVLFGGNGGAICNSGKLVMADCEIVGNAAGTGGTGGAGGGVWNGGAASIKNCVISNNAAGAGTRGFRILGSGGPGGEGGGICNAGTLVIDRCAISANSAGKGADGVYVYVSPNPYPPVLAIGAGGSGGNGGGIVNLQRILMRDSTINGNSGGAGGTGFTVGAGAGGCGAGICNLGAAEINTCTVSENQAGPGGQGQDNPGEGGSGGAGGSGAGIYSDGALLLTSCTIVSNLCGGGGFGGSTSNAITFFDFWVAIGGSGGAGGSGGGVCLSQTSRVCLLRNTLLAGNAVGGGAVGGTVPALIPRQGDIIVQGADGADGLGPNISGSFHSGGFNLISVTDSSARGAKFARSDILGSGNAPIEPLVGPLQNNGGLTLTHALQPGSPAIDRGYSFGINRDQCGQPRPQNYPAVSNAPGGDGTDIGSVESIPPRRRFH